MELALANNPALVRDDAMLIVMIVSATDEPHADVSRYAAFAHALSLDVSVEVVAPAAQNLETFLASFPNRATFTSIENEDWPMVLPPSLGSGAQNPCIPATPPLECVVTANDELVPACGGERPCWRLAFDSTCGEQPRLQIDRDRFPR